MALGVNMGESHILGEHLRKFKTPGPGITLAISSISRMQVPKKLSGVQYLTKFLNTYNMVAEYHGYTTNSYLKTEP